MPISVPHRRKVIIMGYVAEQPKYEEEIQITYFIACNETYIIIGNILDYATIIGGSTILQKLGLSCFRISAFISNVTGFREHFFCRTVLPISHYYYGISHRFVKKKVHTVDTRRERKAEKATLPSFVSVLVRTCSILIGRYFGWECSRSDGNTSWAHTLHFKCSYHWNFVMPILEKWGLPVRTKN
jgi:hypothetical protein